MRKVESKNGFIIAVDRAGLYSVFSVEEWSCGSGFRYSEYESIERIEEARELLNGLIEDREQEEQEDREQEEREQEQDREEQEWEEQDREEREEMTDYEIKQALRDVGAFDEYYGGIDA